MCRVVRVHIKEVFLKGAYAWGKYFSENSQKLEGFWKIVKTDPCGFGENLWMIFFMYCGLFLLNNSHHMNLQ